MRYYREILFVITIAVFGCNNSNAGRESTAENSSRADRRDSGAASKETSSINEPENKLVDTIPAYLKGKWALVGSENVTFVIDKNKIIYPDNNASYSYAIAKDTLKISYEDYQGSFPFSFRGKDTLVLKGGEQQVYYRFRR